MKGRLLQSKAMMLVSRLPLSLSFSSFLEFFRIGLVTMTIILFLFNAQAFL